MLDVSEGSIGSILFQEIFISFCNDSDFAPLMTYDTNTVFWHISLSFIANIFEEKRDGTSLYISLGGTLIDIF